MISIFQGRKLSLDGTKKEIYAEVAVSLRDKLHLFNTGKSLNSFAVFMCISLHANADGWAWPSRGLLQKETGFSTSETIGHALKHLRSIEIDGYHFLKMYREYNMDKKRWGRTVYRIFPDGFKEDMATAPFPNLKPWDPKPKARPTLANPDAGDPDVGYIGDMKDPHSKENHDKELTTTEPEPKKEAPKVVVEKPPSAPPSRKVQEISVPFVQLPHPVIPSTTTTDAPVVAVPLDDEEITPGFRITRSDDEPRVHRLLVPYRAHHLTCPDCETESEWPPTDNRRRQHPLVCRECGALFVVKTETKSGHPRTYSKPIARVATSFWVQVDDAPDGFKSFKASQADAELLYSTWKERKAAVLEGLKWMAGKKSAAKWGNIAASLLVTIQRNGTRDNAWGVKRDKPKPKPRPPTDWNAAMREAAETNADLFAEEDSE